MRFDFFPLLQHRFGKAGNLQALVPRWQARKPRHIASVHKHELRGQTLQPVRRDVVLGDCIGFVFGNLGEMECSLGNGRNAGEAPVFVMDGREAQLAETGKRVLAHASQPGLLPMDWRLLLQLQEGFQVTRELLYGRRHVRTLHQTETAVALASVSTPT